MASKHGSSVDRDSDLPAEVLSALAQRHKIKAIKLLRERRGIDLKTAKQTVDGYLADHPHLAAARGDRAESSLGRLLLIVVVLAAVFAAYHWFPPD